MQVAWAQSTGTAPGTGRSSAAGRDSNWKVVSSSIQGETATGSAFLVSNLPGGWVTPAAGLSWIAPADGQTNASRLGTCCGGQSTYAVKFNVTDSSTAQLNLMMAADEGLLVYMNGYDDAHIVYINLDPTFTSPIKLSLRQGAISHTYDKAGILLSRTVVSAASANQAAKNSKSKKTEEKPTPSPPSSQP